MATSLFVSHGSPMLALEPGPWAARFRALGDALPEVRRVVVMSPHWRAVRPMAGSAVRLVGEHDHVGFPPALYRLQWSAPGDPALADDLARHLGADDAQPVTGVDHGAWVPLALMFPGREVAVVPLAQPARLDAAGALALGRALADLAAPDLLVLGTGGLTHNLSEFRGQPRDAPAAPYVTAFAEWFARRLEDGDEAALVDWRRAAPEAARAHPTDEHLLPLFLALGAAGPGARARRMLSGSTHAVLAMDAWHFVGSVPPRG